jgi:alpha-mannosidase
MRRETMIVPSCLMPLCVLLSLGVFLAAHPIAPRRGMKEVRPGAAGAEIQIHVTGPASLETDSYINGFAESVSGQTINYHSAHADAESALIVRAQSIARSIAWKTDPLPADAPGDFYRLIWLAGLEFSGWAEENNEHFFELSINGQHWFTFKNAKDATARKWSVKGQDGAELSFEATTADKFGDLFGYMHLNLPKKSFPPGSPLVLEVLGQDANSPDWYMTFQYHFNFAPRVRVEPALVRDAGATAQLLRLSLDNLTPGRTIDVRMGGRELVRDHMLVGANIFRLPIPAVKSPEPITVRFCVNDADAELFSVTVHPATPREFYLTSYSHNDIGYTELQSNVERTQWRNLEEGLRLGAETRDFPLDARFKWNLETIWALESYLRQASAEKRQTVFAAIREGSLGVSALYANMLTGLANSVEMSHFLDFARRLREENHIEVTTAVTSDVPGFSWGIVPALAQSGVKYFAVGPNSGDRIGYTLKAWGDKPFYWVSQSGKEKVLIWVAGASYAMFHEGTLSALGDEKVMKLARQLDENGYPHEMVYLPYTQGDNGPPDATLAAFVKRWNERYVTPRLVLATHEQMFREFEKRYAASIPSFGGDFTPYWEDGAASTAAELALARRAVNQLIQGEVLWSMLAPREYPRAEYEAAWRNVVFWDEHTWGAHNSVSDPDLPSVKEQWAIKRKFAVDAAEAASSLLARAFHAPAQSPGETAAFDVYNTSSWARTDLVALPAGQTALGDQVVDSEGRPLPSQRLSTGELAVLVESVPPLAARRLFVSQGTPFLGGHVSITTSSLENEEIALHVSRQSGAIDAARWKQGNIALVDSQAAAGWGEYLYVPGADPAKVQRLSTVHTTIRETGPLVASLEVEASAPGAEYYRSEIRLVAGLPRADIVTTIDKRAVRVKEGVHIAFPFRVPRAVVRYDVAGATVRPETDQLGGACKNFFSVVSWADASNPEFGLTLAVPDAPLVEMGAITAEQPWMRTIQHSPILYSYVMNNYWHTNYKADQAGPVKFACSIAPHGAYGTADAERFGRERREPLLVVRADVSRPVARSLLRIAPAEVLVNSLKPLGDGRSLLLSLYNPTEEAQRVTLRVGPGLRVSSQASDASGRAGESFSGAIPIAAHDTLYLRVTMLDLPAKHP